MISNQQRSLTNGISLTTNSEWKFVEAPSNPGTIADLSGHGFDLTVSGVEKCIKFEKIDDRGVLTLAGTSEYVADGQFRVACNIPESTFDPAAGFTFEMFFMPGEEFQREGTQTFLSNMSDGTKPGFVFQTRYHKLEVFSGAGHPYSAGENPGTGKVSSEPLTPPFKPGQWYHVAAVYNGSKLTLYRDGLMVAESDGNFMLTPGSETYSIGSLGGTAYGFVGSIAWAKLSDKALTSEEVLQSANSAAE